MSLDDWLFGGYLLAVNLADSKQTITNAQIDAIDYVVLNGTEGRGTIGCPTSYICTFYLKNGETRNVTLGSGNFSKIRHLIGKTPTVNANQGNCTKALILDKAPFEGESFVKVGDRIAYYAITGSTIDILTTVPSCGGLAQRLYWYLCERYNDGDYIRFPEEFTDKSVNRGAISELVAANVLVNTDTNDKYEFHRVQDCCLSDLLVSTSSTENRSELLEKVNELTIKREKLSIEYDKLLSSIKRKDSFETAKSNKPARWWLVFGACVFVTAILGSFGLNTAISVILCALCYIPMIVSLICALVNWAEKADAKQRIKKLDTVENKIAEINNCINCAEENFKDLITQDISVSVEAKE